MLDNNKRPGFLYPGLMSNMNHEPCWLFTNYSPPQSAVKRCRVQPIQFTLGNWGSLWVGKPAVCQPSLPNTLK